jgi:mitochondrial chaperone BCS1
MVSPFLAFLSFPSFSKSSRLFAFVFALLSLAMAFGWNFFFALSSPLLQLSSSLNIHSLFPLIKDLLQHNQFCQAVVFSSISAYLLYVIQLFYRSYILPLFSGMISSVTIHNTDPNFHAVIDFISESILANTEGSQSTLQATTHQPKKITRKDWIQEYLGTDQRNVDKFEFRPDSDHAIHRFLYEGKVIFMTRSKSSEPLPLTGRDVPFTPESLTLSVWGSNSQVLKNLLQASLEASVRSRQGNVVRIYTQSNSNWIVGWELAMMKNRREKTSVILDDNDMDFLLNDARKFLKGSQWYADMGIPYRRGYLLYGPPGCGKTSFAQVLASELNLDISMLNLTHSNMNDNKLAEYLRDAPFNSIIVLEDVDAIFVERNLTKRHSSDDSSSSMVSFSGLLNAIDGVASQEGRIFFMTTNHVEKLDPALIRPGRCDVRLEVKKASKQQMEKMFLRFFPQEKELAVRFASQLPSHELSMAALQGHFLKGDQSAMECVQRIPELLQSAKPPQEETRSIFEHLRRVGLERYTSLFEMNGCETVDDLVTFDEKSGLQVSDLAELSAELSYDLQGQKMLAQLLQSTSKSKSDSPHIQNFLRSSYALADVATMRETFLSFFSRSSTPAPVAAEEEAEDLSLLSHQFCEILSEEGKGMISHFQLRQLLEMHPHRPGDCVKSAKAFLKPRNRSQEIQSMSLYQFLKRAGLGKHIHSFRKQGIKTVADLLAIEQDKDLRKFGKKLKSDFKLSSAAAKGQRNGEGGDEEGIGLAEILTKTRTSRHSYHNFGLYQRGYVMQTFLSFYGKGGCSSAGEGEDREGAGEAETEAVKIDQERLDDLSYEFSVRVTDEKGRALVSILEILKHLRAHSFDPQLAVETALEELVNPPFPSPPCSSPEEPKPVEWVHEWLSSQDSAELAPYSSKFVKEGLCTEEDLAQEPLFTEEILEKIGVNKLGHRRVIIRMQAALIQKR